MLNHPLKPALTRYLKRHFRRLFVAVAAIVLVAAMAASLRAQHGEMSFGYDRRDAIQLVDPDGSNQIPFWSGGARSDVQFALYPLDIADFLAIYAASNQPLGTDGRTPQVQWQQSFADRDRYGVMTDVPLPFSQVPSGIYIIEAVHGSERAASLMVLGPHALVAKWSGDGQVLVWAEQLQLQAPVVDMQVTLYDGDANVISTAKTDSEGFARFDVGNAYPWVAVGRTADAVSVVGLNGTWQSDGTAWFPPAAAPARQVYLYTDRPIYRPDQTIHYNAFVRRHSPDGYQGIDASEPYTATLYDARGNVIAVQALTTDAYGSVNGEFSLDDEAPLGQYRVELTDGRQSDSRSFEVEEYRKPEYEVVVDTPADHVISGDPIPITVEADYFFGQPVAGAEVELTVFRRRQYSRGWWWYYEAQPHPDGEVARLRATLDNEGRWTTEYRPESIEGLDAIFIFSATVTDARELPVVGRRQVNVHWNAHSLNVAAARYGYEVGDPVAVKLSATNHDGTQRGGGEATLRVLSYEYGGTQEDAVAPQTVAIDGDGRATVTYDDLPRGWYRVEASTVDERGRDLVAHTYLWVYGGGSRWWYTSSEDLSLLLDRDAYAPGDTARLLIQSRVNGLALLTLERDGIHLERLVTLSGPVTAVDIPVEAGYAPNVHVNLHVFALNSGDDPDEAREGRLVSAKIEMDVPAHDKRLTVDLSSDAGQYLPGETATLTVRLKEADGEPTAGRVSLALVDEAIFALSKDKSGNIFDTFYGYRASWVSTSDSLVRNPIAPIWLWGPITLVDEENGPLPTPTEPSPGPPTRAALQETRTLFKDTAFWHPAIDVGEDGVATVQVTLPDNLTTWRIIAKAITQDTEVGESAGKILVTKEIIARPALPRFVVLGDQFEAGVVGQNFSGGGTSGDASLDSDALVLLDEGLRVVNVPDGGSAVVRWSAVASEAGVAKVLATLSTAAGADSVEEPLPILPFAVPERVAASGQANPEAIETFNMPFNAVSNASDLTVRLSPSVALGVLDGLDDLIDYPYGCVEQTMSRVLPSAVASRAYAELGIPNPKAEELPEIIGQGLQKLYGFQHSNGAWGWFYDDEGGVYLTSYVLFGLLQVQEAGYDVNERVVKNGLDYLDRHLDDVEEPGTLAFSLYVKALAGEGDGERTRALLAQQKRLDAAGLAFLATTLAELGDQGAAQTAADRLLTLVDETATTAFWPAPSAEWGWYQWRSMTSAEKNTALAVQALAKLRPDDVRLPKAVRWLMSHRRGAGWSNTQATAFAVLGLTDYIRLSGELSSNYSYAVELNGVEIAGGKVTPENVTEPIAPIVVPGDALRIGDNRLRIAHDGGELTAAQLTDRRSGAHPLYYSVLLRQSLYYDDFTPVSSTDLGVGLKRSYRLVEGSARQDGAYDVGDVVEVALDLVAREDMWYVMVQDPLPAGFEAIAERLNAVNYGSYYDSFHWHEWGYNRKDLRDDRVDFFITYLWTGPRRLTYLMRATTPGVFSVLPGQVYPMYNEAIWGRTGSAQVSVAPERLAARPRLAGDFDNSCAVGDFDLQLAASAWRTTSTRHDLTADGFVDLADLAAVGARRGADCREDKPMPGAAAVSATLSADLSSANAMVGQSLSMPLRLDGLASPSGYAVTVRYDPTRLRFVGVDHGSSAIEGLPLGPVVDARAGEVHLGSYDLSAMQSGAAPMATLRFTAIGVGPAWAEVVGAQVTDGEGRLASVLLDAETAVVIDGEETFLPVIE